MGRQLNATVYVIDKDGKTHSFGPGDTVPAWAKRLITNDDVWSDGADEETVAVGEGPAPVEAT